MRRARTTQITKAARPPHPSGGGFVGRYVHPYDSSRSRQPYQSPIPPMRAAHDPAGDPSPTPIYDSLYLEYRRQFRALPGDRTGEEELGFKAFGTRGLQQHGMHHHTVPDRHDPRHNTFQGAFHVARYGQHPGHVPGHHGTHQFPAALPPGPRRER